MYGIEFIIIVTKFFAFSKLTHKIRDGNITTIKKHLYLF